MTLTTHAVIGAAIASFIPEHPILGFVLAFGSHFLLDAIPHWDYAILSQKVDNSDYMNNDMIVNGDFFVDLYRIGLDALLGMSLALLFFDLYGPHLFFIPIIGAVGAILPDSLQFAYWKWRHEPLVSLQKFHLWIHAKKNWNGQPGLGVPLQIIIIITCVLLFRAF